MALGGCLKAIDISLPNSMSTIQKFTLWSIFILLTINGQENTVSPAGSVQLNTTNGIVNWPSMGSVDQKSSFIELEQDEYQNFTNKVPKTYENYSSVVEVGKEYILNANQCYMYGSLAMEKIDIKFEMTDSYGKTTDWYETLKNWGNSSKTITDEEVSLALDAAFSSPSLKLVKLRLISLTMESAKPSGNGFETLVFLNNVGYAQRWSGEFGGTFIDPLYNTTLSLNAQNKQRLINFSKVTGIDLVGKTMRIVADRALLTLEVSSISLPLVNTSITKGTLKLQGLKSIESLSNATLTNPSLVLPLNTWSGSQYWPSVGNGEKRVINPKNELEKDILKKTFSSSSISIAQNTPFKPEMSDFYLYGTASLEQVDIEIYPLEDKFQNKAWYRIFEKWGKSTTRPITDEEISLAMDSLFNKEAVLRKFSAESITGNGLETLGILSYEKIAYAQTWKGTFGGSFPGTKPSFSKLKLKPIANRRILKFSNITKVGLVGYTIQIVAAKAILSLDVSELYTSTGIATMNKGSLTLEGFASQSGFFADRPILLIALIVGSIAFSLFVIYNSIRYFKRSGDSSR
ncbi:hypothetical protein HDV02_002285 [Globomyces sp. JEL0801]|nr:hypothetical protein HDV02_002285 [Globomyces sp. JEL0801]